ncbi:MAG: 50S ribosomal protein L18Ae [Candidatus Hodarchaeales archaeon]|jgi:large subunit ribosomal protein LX
MSDIKIKNFKITGEFRKNRDVITFTRVKRGLKKAECIDQIYKELGSKHRVKRDKIKVTGIQVIKDEDLEDPVLKSLADGKNVRIVFKD